MSLELRVESAQPHPNSSFLSQHSCCHACYSLLCHHTMMESNPSGIISQSNETKPKQNRKQNYFFHYGIFSQHSGLNENDHHSLIYLNVWSTVSTVWEGLRAMILEEVCQQGQANPVSPVMEIYQRISDRAEIAQLVRTSIAKSYKVSFILDTHQILKGENLLCNLAYDMHPHKHNMTGKFLLYSPLHRKKVDQNSLQISVQRNSRIYGDLNMIGP